MPEPPMPKADGPSTGRAQSDIFTGESEPRSAIEPDRVSPPDAQRRVEGGARAQVAESNAPPSGGADSLPSSFESALNELEAVVARMESGELSLEQSLSAYQRGAALLQYCQGKLHDAQQQVKILESGVLRDFSGVGDNGQ
jgi:exodeoxyribonuclease VII small subunit